MNMTREQRVQAQRAFYSASKYLFCELSDDNDITPVCIEHECFIPCRTCMYDRPADVPYSDQLEDIRRVQQAQQNCAT